MTLESEDVIIPEPEVIKELKLTVEYITEKAPYRNDFNTLNDLNID